MRAAAWSKARQRLLGEIHVQWDFEGVAMGLSSLTMLTLAFTNIERRFPMARGAKPYGARRCEFSAEGNEL